MEDSLGQAHRADLQARKPEFRGPGVDELGRAAADVDDEQALRRIEAQAAHHRQVRQPGLGLARNDLQFDARAFAHAADEDLPVGGVAQRRGASGHDLFGARGARLVDEFRDRVERAQRGLRVEAMVLVDALSQARDAREIDHPARAAVGRGLGHEHQDRVGADVERANLH